MKRLLGPLLLVILVIGVGAAIFFSARNQLAERQVVTVKGLIGSEKEPFFQDQRVIQALRAGGFVVQYEKAGSRTIATSYDLSKYDFAFPAGVPAAEKIRLSKPGAKEYDVFFTPMAIASWKPIVQILEAPISINNKEETVVTQDANGFYNFDMKAYLDLVSSDERWNQINNNNSYPVSKSILISSTDVRKSNSAAMYLALASYVANNNNIVQSDSEIQSIQPLMASLFLKQGYTGYSSEEPFQDYLARGMGKAPLVMIYEAQFISQSAQPNGVNSDMVLMYPKPTIYSKHVLVSLSPNGERLGDLLQNDPTLRRLAIEYGFRNSDQAYFKQFTQSHQLKIPDTLVNVIEPPSYDFLEKMIQNIEQQYK